MCVLIGFCCHPLLRNTLLQTIKHVMTQLEYVKSKGVEVRFHGRGKNEASHYCGQCEVRIGICFFGYCTLLKMPIGIDGACATAATCLLMSTSQIAMSRQLAERCGSLALWPVRLAGRIRAIGEPQNTTPYENSTVHLISPPIGIGGTVYLADGLLMSRTQNGTIGRQMHMTRLHSGPSVRSSNQSYHRVTVTPSYGN